MLPNLAVFKLGVGYGQTRQANVCFSVDQLTRREYTDSHRLCRVAEPETAIFHRKKKTKTSGFAESLAMLCVFT